MESFRTHPSPCPKALQKTISILRRRSPTACANYNSFTNPFWRADFIDWLYDELDWRNNWIASGSPDMPFGHLSSAATRKEVIQALWTDETIAAFLHQQSLNMDSSAEAVVALLQKHAGMSKLQMRADTLRSTCLESDDFLYRVKNALSGLLLQSTDQVEVGFLLTRWLASIEKAIGPRGSDHIHKLIFKDGVTYAEVNAAYKEIEDLADRDEDVNEHEARSIDQLVEQRDAANDERRRGNAEDAEHLRRRQALRNGLELVAESHPPTRVAESDVKRLQEESRKFAERVAPLAREWVDLVGISAHNEHALPDQGAGIEAGYRFFDLACNGAGVEDLAARLVEMRKTLGSWPIGNDDISLGGYEEGIWIFFSQLARYYDGTAWRPPIEWRRDPTKSTGGAVAHRHDPAPSVVLGSEIATEGQSSGRATSSNPEQSFSFNGKAVTICFEGKTFLVKDLKGMRHIARILEAAGAIVTAAQLRYFDAESHGKFHTGDSAADVAGREFLVNSQTPVQRSGAQEPAIDREAKYKYQKRLA